MHDVYIKKFNGVRIAIYIVTDFHMARPKMTVVSSKILMFFPLASFVEELIMFICMFYVDKFNSTTTVNLQWIFR